MSMAASNRSLAITMLVLANLSLVSTSASSRPLDLTPNTTLIGSLPLGNCEILACRGDWVLAGINAQGLHFVDISDPTTPLDILTWPTIALVDVEWANDIAVLLSGSNGLEILDLTDPSEPVLLGSHSGFPDPTALALAGNRIFVSDFQLGLIILDCSDPASIMPLGTFSPSVQNFYFWDVAVSGDYAFVADFRRGMRIIDVSDPALPDSTGFFPTGDFAECVTVDGDLVLLGDSLTPGSDTFGGLRIISATQPWNPYQLAAHEVADLIPDVVTDGDYAYIVAGGSGLQIVDIRNPDSPFLAGYFETAGWAPAVAVRGNLIILADDSTGLQIIRNDLPLTPAPLVPRSRILEVGHPTPNPCNPLTAVTFQLDRGSMVKMEIFDLKGRLIRLLPQSGDLGPGVHSVDWNGKDDFGRPAPSGTYFFRFEAGDVGTVRPLTLVR